MVTATAVLIRSIDPTLTAAQIKDIIASTASHGPAQLGGKSLLVDAAVRKAIDGVRKRAGVAPLTDQAIADGRTLCQISVQTSMVRRLQAPAGSSTWNVAASLAVVPKSTYVTLAVDGRGPAEGQALTTPGSAAWTVTVPKDGAVVVISRTDNDYWVALRLLDMGQQEPLPATEPPAPQTLAPTSSASPLCSDTDPYWDPVGGLMCPTEVPKVGG